MADYEIHRGGFTETPTQVSFTIVVRDGTGKVDLGVATITLPKPLTEAALRAAINNAAKDMLSPATKPQAYIEEVIRRMNRGL
mgnify:CR=1 FL=1